MEDTAVTSGTTATETAAPSTSASVTPDQRPTMAQAFASDAATSSESTAQPEAATTQPAETSETQAPVHPSEKTGPIPFDVHKTALDNARTKAVAEYKEKFGWAESVDRAAVEEAARIGHLYQTDKVGYIRQIVSEALSNQELAPLVRSEAARVLAGAKQKEPQTTDIEPDIPVVDDQGRVVSQAFSAGKVKELIARAVQDAIGKEVAPIKADYQNRQQQEQAEKQKAQIDAAVATTYERAVASLPKFKEHESEIAAMLATIPVKDERGRVISEIEALQMAWAKVVPAKLESQAQSKTLEIGRAHV